MTTTQTRPRPGRAAREERAPVRRWSGPAWLDGPMTSCHLVLGSAGLLLLIGLVMVFSASSIEAALADEPAWAPGVQQLIWAGLGLGAMLVTMRLPIGLIRRWSPIGLVVVAVLLLLVLVPGIGVRLNGARQWIDLGFTLFQPSELAKIVFALWGAHVLALRERYLTTSSLLVPVLPVFGVLSLLIIAEPDFGGVVSLGLVLTGLLWAGGMPLRWFGLAAAGGAALLAVVVTVSAERRDRLTSFMDPFADPTDSGFQAIRGMYALASGGLWGVGLGNSAMKWNILPEAESDYIFAIIGEELGFLGCLVVVTLYGVLAYAGFRIARRAADRFVQLSCVAITVWLVGQATMNMGYVVGLLPVTGVTLPLISAGGTSLILTLAVVGLLARFACTEPAAVESLSSRDRGRISRLLLPAPAAAVEPVRPRRRPEDRDARSRVVGSGRTLVHARSAPARSQRPAERPARTPPPPARRPGGQR
ncbi:cell division-specific peptidoglycan biosynthesis regulator FtsW [Blastococcus aggregatus]|uniref:Probable peptidoglycan glycosyltransferase FtsW n=1 Tax=Blastococcus aggregatus TaxID=38502 RepID=A0A285V9R8_9ACTN|nr:putative lipid II flippase FtsW [Blastococcus aggregatus]SOC50697.1 cell division-specific peptidoglycan biosynthesis regulator FtsW [Blastococcus aggregatus]